MTAPPPTWSTLFLRPAARSGGSSAMRATDLPSPRPTPGRPRAPAPDPIALESLASLLALDPDVEGVQEHDDHTWDTRTEPALTVFTSPAAADLVAKRALALARDLGLTLDVTRQDHQGDDHLDTWREFHRPATYGAPGGLRLLVRPSWHARSPDDPSLEIVLDPGRAFGTGRHESTRLCLGWLCRQRPGPSPRVLDLGCGSGILGLAAARLFHAHVTAADTDPEATATTAENAADNALTVTTHTGGLDTLPPGRFELILANIRPTVLVPAAPGLLPRLAPGGAMILSGILDEEADTVTRAYAEAGGQVTRAGELEGWVALEVRGEELPP